MNPPSFQPGIFYRILFKDPPKSIVDAACTQSQISLKTFYNGCVWFSLTHLLFMSLFTERRSFLRKTLRLPEEVKTLFGRIVQYLRRYPGLPVPVNLMSSQYFTAAYTAAYVCAFSVIGAQFTGVFDIKDAFPEAPVWLKVCYKIFAISVMSTTLLPIFFSITIGGIFNWTVGAIYSMCHVIYLTNFLIRRHCLGIDELLRKASLNAPILISTSYLCCYFLYKILSHCSDIRDNLWSTKCTCQNSYVLKNITHVRQLLKVTLNDHSIKKRAKFCQGYFSIFYSDTGFTYPTGLIWSLTVGVILQHLLLTQFILRLNTLAQNGKLYIWENFPELRKTFSENIDLSNARHVHMIFFTPRNDSKIYHRMEWAYVYYWLDVAWLCVILAVGFAIIMNILNVFRVLHHYRELSKVIREHGFRAIPDINIHLTPFLATRGSVIYPSYQVALLACGFYLQVITYTGIAIFFAVIVTLNAFTQYNFLTRFFQTWWPGMLIMTIFAICQQLVIRFLFTQHRGKSFGFDNVRWFQLYCFFAGFYSIFFGLISGFGRILYCPISSALHISRLDVSPLAKPIQSSDTGYVAFLGFLYTDLLKNNPTFRVFLCLLITARSRQHHGRFLDKFLADEVEIFDQLLHRPAKVSRQGIHLSTLEKAIDDAETFGFMPRHLNTMAKRRWWLAYTLVRNPGLCQLRRRNTPVKLSPEAGVQRL